MTDAINPTYYKDGWSNGAEVIDIVEHLPYSRGAAVKYLARAGKKGGAEKELEDLEKAQWYVNREIELVKRKMCLAEKDDASLKVNWIADHDAVTFSSETDTDEEDGETDGERAVSRIMDLIEEYGGAVTSDGYEVTGYRIHPYIGTDLSDGQKIALADLLESACNGDFGDLEFINVVLFEICRNIFNGWNVVNSVLFNGEDAELCVMPIHGNFWRTSLKDYIPNLSQEVDIFCDLIEEIYGGECK